jgi:hypothetical protein
VLSLALEVGAIVPGGRSPVTLEDLNRAADDMKALAEHCLDVGFADHHDSSLTSTTRPCCCA